ATHWLCALPTSASPLLLTLPPRQPLAKRCHFHATSLLSLEFVLLRYTPYYSFMLAWPAISFWQPMAPTALPYVLMRHVEPPWFAHRHHVNLSPLQCHLPPRFRLKSTPLSRHCGRHGVVGF